MDDKVWRLRITWGIQGGVEVDDYTIDQLDPSISDRSGDEAYQKMVSVQQEIETNCNNAAYARDWGNSFFILCGHNLRISYRIDTILHIVVYLGRDRGKSTTQ